ncbi:MAG: hypothetical protein HY888_14525, partial [Deltaproteobacteria bacterium]|nr:hypothetical protein [Deltaproteobacteria bacterium]
MSFDPFGQLARLIPEARLHQLIRLAMVAILAAFLIHRATQYRIYYLKPLWLVETLLFVILIAAFLLRSAPCNRSSGIREIIIPLVGSALPFALLLSPPAEMVTGNRTLLLGALWWMTAA